MSLWFSSVTHIVKPNETMPKSKTLLREQTGVLKWSAVVVLRLENWTRDCLVAGLNSTVDCKTVDGGREWIAFSPSSVAFIDQHRQTVVVSGGFYSKTLWKICLKSKGLFCNLEQTKQPTFGCICYTQLIIVRTMWDWCDQIWLTIESSPSSCLLWDKHTTIMD